MSRNNCVGEAWLCGGPKNSDCYMGKKKKKSANLSVEPLFSCCELAFPGNIFSYQHCSQRKCNKFCLLHGLSSLHPLAALSCAYAERLQKGQTLFPLWMHNRGDINERTNQSSAQYGKTASVNRRDRDLHR